MVATARTRGQRVVTISYVPKVITPKPLAIRHDLLRQRIAVGPGYDPMRSKYEEGVGIIDGYQFVIPQALPERHRETPSVTGKTTSETNIPRLHSIPSTSREELVFEVYDEGRMKPKGKMTRPQSARPQVPQKLRTQPVGPSLGTLPRSGIVQRRPSSARPRERERENNNKKWTPPQALVTEPTTSLQKERNYEYGTRDIPGQTKPLAFPLKRPASAAPRVRTNPTSATFKTKAAIIGPTPPYSSFSSSYSSAPSSGLDTVFTYSGQQQRLQGRQNQRRRPLPTWPSSARVDGPSCIPCSLSAGSCSGASCRDVTWTGG